MRVETRIGCTCIKMDVMCLLLLCGMLELIGPTVTVKHCKCASKHSDTMSLLKTEFDNIQNATGCVNVINNVITLYSKSALG